MHKCYGEVGFMKLILEKSLLMNLVLFANVFYQVSYIFIQRAIYKICIVYDAKTLYNISKI